MKYEIIGDDFQVLHCRLSVGEKIFAEAGQMIFASENVILEARAQGGVGGMMRRVITGESLLLTEFRVTDGEGIVAFGKKLGKIVPIEVSPGKSITARTDSYAVSTDMVNVKAVLTKRIAAGFLGGKGFILQAFTTESPDQTVFLEASGQVITFDLKEGQVIKVDTGNIVAFESTVDFDVQRVGGVKTMVLGGEGFFLSILRGPGRVWIQSANLAELIAKLTLGTK